MVALRFPAAMGWGAAITIALFALLSSLVNVKFNADKPREAVRIDFTRLTRPPPVEPPVRPPPLVPTITTLPPGPTGPNIDDPVIGRPGRGERVGVPTFGTEIPTGPATLGFDGDALPVVRVAPDYPQKAINGEIEGWVDVQFSVTATGAVRDVVIVDSNPKDIFDAAVLKAVGRWRYNPRVDEGVAVERVGMRTRILFELDRAQAR